MSFTGGVRHRPTGGRYEPGEAAVPGPETLDTALALHLLSLRRRSPGPRTGRAGYAPKRASEKELNEAILARLGVLARRLRRGRSFDTGSFEEAHDRPRQARSLLRMILRYAVSTSSTATQDDPSIRVLDKLGLYSG